MDVVESALTLVGTASTIAEMASTLAEKVVEPMRKQGSYAIQYKRKIDDLTSKVENLTYKKQRVNKLVEAAEMNLDPIDPEVKSWLSDAEQTIARKDENFGEERLASAWCFNGWCPNPKSRYSLGKSAEEMSLVVDDLLQKDLPTVSYPAPPPGILPSVSTQALTVVHEAGTSAATVTSEQSTVSTQAVTMVPGASTSAATSNLLVPETIAFESRTLMIEDVMDALTGEEFNPIVICGMGGIGKTTMLKEIRDRAKAPESPFNEFAWANVTRTPDLSTIQNDIGEFLGLKQKLWKYKNEEIRKEKLCERLSGKRVLVILDDVWDTKDIKDMGIPLFSKSCKILISSRSQEIFGSVQSRKKFTIEELEAHESWSLFKQTAGGSIESPELRPIAEQVLRECANLPIAISTVGTALYGKEHCIWKDALRQLRKAIPKNIPAVVRDVYQKIEFSYKSLESDELKLCFLLCCVYPEGSDVSIENLVQHGLGLGLFDKEIDSIVQARNFVKGLTGRLKSFFLLLDSDKQGCVRMHDVVRDVALFIASSNLQQKKSTSEDDHQIGFFVRHEVELEGWPKGEYISSEIITNGTTHQNAAEVTGMNSELLLLSSSTDKTMKPPETILKKREKLKVLDFKKTDISLMLPMFPLLENLQTLCLENCVLGDASMIGKLQKLLILKLSGSSIKQLPESFKNLSNLWLPDLTQCEIQGVCPSGVISCLAKLQELRMRISWRDRRKLFVQDEVVLELLSLCNLKTLEVELPSIIDLDEYLQKGCKLLDGLERFQISIKHFNPRQFHTFTDSDWSRDFKPSENFLKLDSDWNSLHRSSISLLLKKTDTLELSMGCSRERLNFLDGGSLLMGLKSLSLNVFDGGRLLVGLKSLSLSEIHALEYVIDMTTSAVNDVLFPVLVSLTMKRSLTLIRICNGVPPVGSFKELRRVEVSSCDGLISLLPLSVARELHQLEEVDIQYCPRLGEIISVDEGEEKEEKALAEMRLPSLTHLNLANLPEFVGMSKNVRLIISFHLLFTVKLQNLPKLISLHPNDSAPEHLFDAKDGSFLELRFIDVVWCNAITSVFSSDSMQSLQNLERLSVKECSSLKTLFDFEYLDVRPGRASTLSCINHMELIDLPLLKYIWKPQPKIQAFQNLRFLEVHSCKTLNNVFPIYVAQGLVQLESFYISRCNSVEEIFCGNDGGGDREDETTSNKIVLSQVKDLELKRLPSLLRFCAVPWILEFPSLRRLVLLDLYELNTALPIAVFHSPSQILYEKVVSSCSIQNLQQLEVRDCRSLERLFHFELGLDNKLEDTIVALSCLEKMELYYLDNLKYLWEPSPKILAFQNLKSLKVASCEKLRFVFPVSTAKSLVKLESIQVEFCEQMKEVLGEVDGEENEIVFPEMQSLHLENLDYLQSFYPASRTLECPSLINLVLCCKRMATFVPENNSYNLAADDFDTYLFNEKVNFPSLKTLELRGMDKIKDIWSNKLVPTTFCELVELQVSECHKLSLLLPLYMQDRLKKLESLTVEGCNSLRDIFEFRGLHSNNGNALTITQQREAPATLQLEKMKIEQTPSFQNLTSISVSNCSNLRYLLPSSLAVSLRNLKTLSLKDCINIEELVVKPAEADEAEDYIVFPQLSHLKLAHLPNLMSFSRGNYTLDWRSVHLTYYGCPKIREFLRQYCYIDH